MDYSYDFAQQVHFPLILNKQDWPTAKLLKKEGFLVYAAKVKVNRLTTLSMKLKILEKELTVLSVFFIDTWRSMGVVKTISTFMQKFAQVKTKLLCFFMLVGYTKFAPVRYFGLIRKWYRRSCVDKIYDIARVVKESSTTTGYHSSFEMTKHVQFYQWKNNFFSGSSSQFPKLVDFYVDAAKPGLVNTSVIGSSVQDTLNSLYPCT